MAVAESVASKAVLMVDWQVVAMEVVMETEAVVMVVVGQAVGLRAVERVGIMAAAAEVARREVVV